MWREKDDLLRTVPGVGPQLSLTLRAHLPELSTLDRKQIAALVGVAPYNRDSGTRRGKRAVLGRTLPGAGPSLYMGAFYMGALVASRHNPAIRDFYQRLLVSRKKWRWSRPCANCWLCSTPCSNMATLGAI